MVIAVLVVLLGALVAGVVWISRRRGADETHSVEGYQHTLSTLQTIRSRSGASPVRIVGPKDVTSGAARAGIVGIRAPGAGGVGAGWDAGAGGPGGTARGQGRTGAPGDPLPPHREADTPPGGLRFDDVSTGADHGRADAGNVRRDRAIEVMNRRPRHLAGPIAAGAAVVVLIAVLVAIGGRSNHGTGAKATGATVTSAPAARQGTTTTARSGTSGGRGTRGSRRVTGPTTPAQYVAVASSATSGTYDSPGASYTLGLSATSGNCWMQVSEVAAGTTPLAQTLTPGQQQSLPVQGEVKVLLGAPGAAAITLDGVPVVLPSGAVAPFTLTFAPPAATSGPTTTSTT